MVHAIEHDLAETKSTHVYGKRPRGARFHPSSQSTALGTKRPHPWTTSHSKAYNILGNSERVTTFALTASSRWRFRAGNTNVSASVFLFRQGYNALQVWVTRSVSLLSSGGADLCSLLLISVPRSRTKTIATFRPVSEGEYDFAILCQV